MINSKEAVKIWARRIDEARQKHREKVINWAEKVLSEYCGSDKTNKDTGEMYSQIAQVVVAVEETVQPHLFFQSPTFYAKSKQPDWEKREPLVSAVINHEYHNILDSGHTLELENELALLDARLLPFGGTKTTYDVEGVILEETPDEGMMDKVKNFITGEKPQPIETPIILNEKGHITERFDPLKVFLDPQAKHITKQRYVIEELDLVKEQISIPRYDQEKVKKMEPDTVISEKQIKERTVHYENYDADQKGYRVYEIHDLKERVIHTYSEQLKDFIEFNSSYPVDEGSQYSFLWFIEEPNEVYPLPPYKFYRSRAKEFSYIYSQVAEQIDKFLPKIGIDITRLDKPGQQRFQAGNLGALVGFNGSPQGAWDVIQPHVNPDLFKYLAMTKELLNMESGSNEFELSAVTPDSDRKAREISEVSQGTRARRFKPKKRVRDFLINQAHIIFLILAKNQDVRKFVKVLGEDEAMEWWSDPETGKSGWTKENLIGDYFFEIDVESMLPANDALRKRQNSEAMTTVLNPALRQSLAEEGTQLLISPIFEKYVKENLGISDKNRVLKKLNGLEPGDEHTLWMQGQYPEIGERELKDPKFLVKHYQAHEMFINSPGFQALQPEIQQGAIQHHQSYFPHIEKLMTQKQNQKPQQKNPEEPEKTEVGLEVGAA